jgi:4-hydroxybenzoate polyprenyltransferase
MMNWLKTIRPINLLIIIITMLSLRYLVIEPVLVQLSAMLKTELVLQMTVLQFSLLVLSVILIAAGGYIINDVYDVEIDRKNKPGKNKVGQQISESLGFNVYYILTATGIITALSLGFWLGNYNLALLHIAVAASLWFYATNFKKSFLIGNLIISLCVGLIPIVVGFYEIVPLQEEYFHLSEKYKNFNLNFLSYWMIGFAVFGFLATLAREITKDMEDKEGDISQNAKTLPIVAGNAIAKIVVVLVYGAMIYGLYHIYVTHLTDSWTFWYFSLLALLLTVMLILTVLAKTKGHYHKVSNLNKVTSILGILYPIGVAYMLYNSNLL